MFCVNCGAALRDGSQFCTSCGAKAPGTGGLIVPPTPPPPDYNVESLNYINESGKMSLGCQPQSTKTAGSSSGTQTWAIWK